MMKSASEVARLESGVLREVDALMRELKGNRVLSIVEPEASLERDLGLGSLERVELVSRLEKRFRAKVAEDVLGTAMTPRELAVAFAESARGVELDLEAADWKPTRMPPPRDAKTLTEVLVRRAQAEPEMPHVFLREDGALETTLTLGELYRESAAVSGGLRASGIEKNDKVALMLPTGRDFLTGFMGTLLAGAVPVPLYPPLSLARLEEFAERQSGIVENSEARLFVTLERGLALGEILKAKAPKLRSVVTVSELEARSGPAPPAEGSGDDTALIQYTSGSTGEPKGVELSHRNLLANIRVIGDRLDIQPDDSGVSWLPLYHDMGLIGAWLTPLYFGIPVAIFSPLAFLARPERWLWTIHRRRGTISPAPNFAYELCVRKIDEEDLEGLDLSSWRVALNGAEPISPETLERFTHRFAPYGFRKTSHFPVYGLAESSLLLTSPERRTGPRIETLSKDALEREGRARRSAGSGEPALRFVSVGKVVSGHEIRIVDAEGEPVPEATEGAVIFRGPSAMRGYYRNEAATREICRENGFFDTGDRGFELDGELFITGRSKDIIIRAGRNFLPQEIEKEAAEVPGVRRGCVAAFGVSDSTSGTEKIVVIAETREDDAERGARLAAEIESRIVTRLGVPLDDIVLVPPRTLPKTSSGKLRRSACRERYLRGELGNAPKTSWSFWARAAWVSLRTAAGRGRSRLSGALFGVYVLFVTGVFLLLGWLVVLGVSRRTLLRRFVHRAARIYLKMTRIPLKIRGAHHLERGGPFVIVANHASYLDPVPMMAALGMDYAFVVKHEAARWPLIGTYIRKLGHVPVERVQPVESARSAAVMQELLDGGRSVVLFPEGTFSYATGIRPFKLGAFKLAAESGCPLVPVALVGTRRWLRDGTWIPRRSALEVVIGEPRSVEASSLSELVRVREETAELLAETAGEPRLDLVSAGPP